MGTLIFMFAVVSTIRVNGSWLRRSRHEETPATDAHPFLTHVIKNSSPVKIEMMLLLRLLHA